ncbi:septation protein A [Aquabacterium sp.]|uniref:septation protein A n=1 Tax=Aquabacterium sp. TaxID=1872578 RepID=UPI0035AF3E20
MKLLFDFLPLVFFFATYKAAENHKDQAIALANQYLGSLVRGGPITGLEAPILLATVVVIVTTLVLVAIMKIRGHKLDKLLWINVGIVTVLGVATVWFRNETFIKWKPTLIYWMMGLAFTFSERFTGQNLLHALVGKDTDVPLPVWRRLSWAWGGFFGFMGVLNLYVAYHYSTDTWVNFKLFGSMGLMAVFVVGQGIYLSRHIKPPAVEADTRPVSS